jgi:hypothetical protein
LFLRLYLVTLIAVRNKNKMMKPNLFLLLIIGILYIACSNKPTEPTKEAPKVTPNEAPKNDIPASQVKAPSCYRYIGTRDSIYLQISEDYNTMSGLLLFKYYQKEQNLGTLEGNMQGDLLIADYLFKSGGRMASRQVAFKKVGDNFIEGFGDEAEVSGKSTFKDVKMLKFDDTRVLRKVPCSQ